MKKSAEDVTWGKLLRVCVHAVRLARSLPDDVMPKVAKRKIYNYEWRIRRYLRKQEPAPDMIKVARLINNVFDTHFDKRPITVHITVSVIGYTLEQFDNGTFRYKEVAETEKEEG